MASEAIPPLSIDRWRSAGFGRAAPATPRRSATPSRSRALPRPRPLPFPAAPAIFPWLAPTFSPGEATVWAGEPAVVESMLELLYAGVASAGGRISLVEGSNRFLPYRLGEIGRALGADPGELLERIRLARAFTAYQMVAMVDGWAREVRESRPHLLVAHELPELFHDAEELPIEERRPLLAHVARTLGVSRTARTSRSSSSSPEGSPGSPGSPTRGPASTTSSAPSGAAAGRSSRRTATAGASPRSTVRPASSAWRRSAPRTNGR
jgi:hypothetical protein